MAEEIAARVSNVSYDGSIESQSASHDRGGHSRAASAGVQRDFEHPRIGLLDQTRQQRFERLSCFRFPKSGKESFYRCARSDFALCLAPHSIGQSEQPSMRASLDSGLREHITAIILIMIAAAAIRDLRKLDFHRGLRRMAKPAGTGTVAAKTADSASRHMICHSEVPSRWAADAAHRMIVSSSGVP